MQILYNLILFGVLSFLSIKVDSKKNEEMATEAAAGADKTTEESATEAPKKGHKVIGLDLPIVGDVLYNFLRKGKDEEQAAQQAAMNKDIKDPKLNSVPANQQVQYQQGGGGGGNKGRGGGGGYYYKDYNYYDNYDYPIRRGRKRNHVHGQNHYMHERRGGGQGRM